MSTFTGTFRLIRLALRRDRIKLPAWITAISLAMVANVSAVIGLYGSSLEKQVSYAATTAPSLVSRLFGGPIQGPDIGEIVINETFLFTAIAMAFMSILVVVRHTRQNEETGRSELIGSAVVGRHASLTAALVVMTGANVVLSALLALAFIANDLPTNGSIITAAALGAVGCTFGVIAAITAQVSENARGANSLAAMILGGVFLLRGIGDSIGSLTANGMGIVSAWPSWLSPIGWGQQIHPFTGSKTWVFWLFGVFITTLTTIAFYLNAHRDLGLGMISVRPGPAKARRSLLSPFGLAWRLQKGILRGWLIGIAITGVTVGLVAKEFGKLLTDNPEVAEIMQQLGGGSNLNDIFFSSMLAIMGIVIAAYAVQSLQRMRSEEAGGQLEPVLSTHVSKPGWMLSHISCTIGGILLLSLVMGLSAGFTYTFVTDAVMSDAFRIAMASLAPVPAILVVAGFAVSIFGIFPRMTITVSWAAFAFCLLIGQFGPILELPHWIMNVSPFAHIPAAPAEPVTVTPLALLLGIAVVLTVTGLLTFRRRDITTA